MQQFKFVVITVYIGSECSDGLVTDQYVYSVAPTE